MSARLPAWDDLEVFLATARQGSLAGAAERLGVNASTVQRRIGKLEAVLHTRLFDRSQRGYALTPAGEDLLAHVLSMEHEVLALSRRIAGRDQSLDGTVRVATVDDIAVTVLSPIVRDFRRVHPGVTLEVAIRSEFASLTRGQADVAIRIGQKPSEPDVIAKPITRLDVSLYASRSYLRKHGRPRSIAELAGHALVVGDARMAGIPMEKVLLPAIGEHNTAYRSNSMLARMVAIRDGIGVGFLGEFAARRERTLERLDIDTAPFGTHLWMAVHADLRRNARVRAFVDFAYERLVAQGDAFTR